MHQNYTNFADAYRIGLKSIMDAGSAVPSVLDPLSKASNFGTANRPYQEIIAHQFTVANPRSCLAANTVLPVNMAYCFGLLAWTLGGRNDVGPLSYYRRGAMEYTDDQQTLSGAFGRRLLGFPGGDQLKAILDRIQADPGHRRTFAPILYPEDNFARSREYPCAVGVQLFLRDDKLTWLTVMRAQQAFTVLPYDAFLFMSLHQFTAASMGVGLGPYIHQSGTFHIYDSEADLVRRLLADDVACVELPELPTGDSAVSQIKRELTEIEIELREAGQAGDVQKIDKLLANGVSCLYMGVVAYCLGRLAYQRASANRDPELPPGLPTPLQALLSQQ